MRLVKCRQGEADWLQARLGIPTASCFSKLITRGGASSKSATPYAYNLVAERILGHSVVEFDNEWTIRGTETETEAFAYYEMVRDVDIEIVGFCLTNDGTAGCSPDGLVGDDGLIEIKCPAPGTHVGYLVNNIGEQYKQQVQGQLWVTGRKWVDLLSYVPAMPPALVRVKRHEPYIKALAAEVKALVEDVTTTVDKILGGGHDDELLALLKASVT